MVVYSVDLAGDLDRQHVPAQLSRVLRIEIVLGILAGTTVVFDDILVVVTHDDREIVVLFDPPFSDGLDRSNASGAVKCRDTIDYVRVEFARLREGRLPLLDAVHALDYGRAGQNASAPDPSVDGVISPLAASAERNGFPCRSSRTDMRVTEGSIEIEVPEQPEEGVGDSVFYNPVQELNRDLTVAVLRAARERFEHAETYLDATAASGVRGVRAAADGWDVTLCDHDEAAVELCRTNLDRNDLSEEVVNRNANAVMHERRFDVVDLDPFGTPIPFADAASQSAIDLLAVTATDTAPLCGAHFESGVRSYSAVPRNTEYHQEMGVRILLGALARTAARYDRAISPLMTHATKHYVRTYLAMEDGATVANEAIEELGYVHHCQHCLWRTHEHGLIADPPAACPNCDKHLQTAGPLWLDAVHDREFLSRVGKYVDDGMGTAEEARALIETLSAELATPTHYDQHRLAKRWGEGAMAMDDFLAVLRDAGYDASRTHYGGTTFKTDADVIEIDEAIHSA